VGCAIGVGAGVTRPPVRLGLDDPTADEGSSATVDEIASEELSRHDADGALVERALEGFIERWRLRHGAMI
jgi:hypothetical protein